MRRPSAPKLISIAIVLASLAACGFFIHREYQQFVLFQNIYGPPPSAKVDRNKPLREQVRRMEIAGRVFDVPLMYINSHPDPGLHQKDGVILRVIWPEMRSVHQLQDKQEYERIFRQEHRLGSVFIEPAASRPSLDVQVLNRVNGLSKNEFIGRHGELEAYHWYHGKPESPELWAEIYLRKDADGKIVDKIECNRGKSARFPGCEHRFVNGNLMYSVSYNKARFFSDWIDMQQRAIGFVNSFEVNSEPKP